MRFWSCNERVHQIQQQCWWNKTKRSFSLSHGFHFQQMWQFRWQLKSHCPQSLLLMFLWLFPAGCLYKKCVRLPICFDMMVCHLHTFQNWAPSKQDKPLGSPDEHTPPWSSDHNSQSGWLRDNIYIHRIDTLCTVGGQHRCTLFCVEGEGFHKHLATLPFWSHIVQLGWAFSTEYSAWAGWQERHPPMNLHLSMDHLLSAWWPPEYCLAEYPLTQLAFRPLLTDRCCRFHYQMVGSAPEKDVGPLCGVKLNDFDQVLTDHTSYLPELEFSGTLIAWRFYPDGITKSVWSASFSVVRCLYSIDPLFWTHYL